MNELFSPAGLASQVFCTDVDKVLLFLFINNYDIQCTTTVKQTASVKTDRFSKLKVPGEGTRNGRSTYGVVT